MSPKDEKNLREVLDKIASMGEPQRHVMQQLHDVILAVAPELRPRIWYGMPGYARSASSPVLVFFRNDDRMSLGVSEKAAFRPAGGTEGSLMPAAWYFEELDEAAQKRVAEIVTTALA